MNSYPMHTLLNVTKLLGVRTVPEAIRSKNSARNKKGGYQGCIIDIKISLMFENKVFIIPKQVVNTIGYGGSITTCLFSLLAPQETGQVTAL